jgi:hypothetical protein
VNQIRLIRKYSSVLNGFDLTYASVGDILLVTEEVAAMLAREGWAERVTEDSHESDIGRSLFSPHKPTA